MTADALPRAGTVRLTEAQRSVLVDLSDREHGALTYHIARRCGSLRTPWATNRLKTLASKGYVERDGSNDERWRITPAGRAALASPEQPR